MPRPSSYYTIAGGHGPYLLGDRLGVGGMGVVYEAMCPRLGIRVAVKFLHPERAADERARQRFEGESIAGRVIAHPNVVAVLDGGETNSGDPFLVMERVRGEPLGRRIARDGSLEPARAIAIVRQVLAGLSTVHDAGIVHADIKSDNVLVEAQDDGTDACKLIDFGLARVQFSSDRVDADPGAHEEWLSGTPEYMAPEVIRGDGPTFASDVYAVGIILYELLTGHTPFGGGNATDIVQRHLEDDVVPPSLRCTAYDLPSSLDYLVLRALQKDPRRRFADARAFAQALARVEQDVLRITPNRSTLLTGKTVEFHRDEAPTLVGGRSRIAKGTPPHARRIGRPRRGS